MYKLSCKMLRILKKNSFQNWSELLAIFTLGRFGIETTTKRRESLEQTTPVVWKNRVLHIYKGFFVVLVPCKNAYSSLDPRTLGVALFMKNVCQPSPLGPPLGVLGKSRFHLIFSASSTVV